MVHHCHWPTIDQRQCVGSMPLDADDGNRSIRQDTTHAGTGLEVFESHRVVPLVKAALSAGGKP
jgi:hypothetical protein